MYVGISVELAFKLIRNDVLTLGQLEDVLLSVYDLNRSIWVDNSNISSVNPSFSINSFPGLFRLSKVALEAVVTTVADLTTGKRLSIFILILTGVLHVRDVKQFEVTSFIGATDMTTIRVK
jgi:hypothetical protein